MKAVNEMGLSSAQRAVLEDDGRRVLVAAGAGSGKTRLLVAYFVHCLIDEGIPVGDLLAVTFTRKAASELVSRIRTCLYDLGRADLARSLGAGTIGTIHSLCRRLLKGCALSAGVDPAFAILEAEAAELLKEEVCREVWSEAIEQASELELAVFAIYDRQLKDEVVPLYDRLRGLGQRRPQVVVEPGSTRGGSESVLVSSIREALAAGGALASRSATLESDLGALAACMTWLECAPGVPDDRQAGLGRPRIAADSGGDDWVTDALHATEAFFPSRRTAAMQPFFQPVREALTLHRQCLAESVLDPLVAAMNGLLSRFHDRYVVKKAELGLLDFADLELRAWELLTLAPGSPGEASLGPRSRLMVDEFQDTNELQCAILEGLGASSLVMVGDHRQSIYRFRGADVDVFKRRESELSTNPAVGRLYRLDVNYRSSGEVLAFVNRLFSSASFFSTGFVALEHGREEGRCKDGQEGTLPDRPRGGACGSAPGRVVSPAVEVLIVERSQDPGAAAKALPMQQAEAEVIGCRVRRLVEEEGWAYRDVVVLLPALTHVDSYQRALASRGVPVYVVRGKGYHSREEVADLRALLKLLVDPHDDIALVSVLRSPLVGLSDDGLYLLGREAKKRSARSLWAAAHYGVLPDVDPSDAHSLRAFVDRVAMLGRRVGRPGLADLIDEAMSQCEYDLCLLSAGDGRRRFANVRKLMRMATEYESLHGPDLAGFVGVLEAVGELQDKEGSAHTLAEGEDVVRVMSIHQAKGLEFPVVVLAGLGSDAPVGAQPRFVVANDGRMGVFLKGSKRQNYEEHDLHLGPAAQIVEEGRARDKEEDVRLLYVAMTRAAERLVLVGARPKADRLDGCRIGRIVLGLGLEVLPACGETVLLRLGDAAGAGGHVWISGVAPEILAAGAAVEPVGADLLEAACPAFSQGSLPTPSFRRVSFSALAAYHRCPRQFYVERILRLGLSCGMRRPEPHELAGWPSGECLRQPLAGGAAAGATAGATGSFAASSGGLTEGWEGESILLPGQDLVLDDLEISSGREVGLLVHGLLERLPLQAGAPGRSTLIAEAERILAVGDLPLSLADIERSLRLARSFWDAPFVQAPELASATRETTFLFAHGEVLVSGVIDLLWKEGGHWHVVDYKTNALGERTVDEVASAYGLQAAVYCLAMLLAGASTVSMDFLFLERPDTPVKACYTQDDVPALRRCLDEALSGLKEAAFPALRGENCGWCAVAEVCGCLSPEDGSPGSDGIQ